MSDVFTKAKRSEIMSRVRGKDTKPELVVRKILHSMGYRYRLHDPKLPGKPDIVLTRHKKIVMVHGCFWHGHKNCKRAQLPSTNVTFWSEKISKNVARDKKINDQLKKMGWDILTVWSCQVVDKDKLKLVLVEFMEGGIK